MSYVTLGAYLEGLLQLFFNAIFKRSDPNDSRRDRSHSLRTYPSSNSPRIMAMANGTKLDVLFRRADGWWYVKVWPTGEEGWAFSGTGNKAWILCCTNSDGLKTETKSAEKAILDFSCEQLLFRRNHLQGSRILLQDAARYCCIRKRRLSV
jgi:hypothetical protein